MATEHRYHRGGLVGDGLRTVAGLALCAWPAAVTSPGPVWTSILAVFALLFAVYGLRAVLRGLSRICLDDVGIRSEGPFPIAIRWDQLTSLKLGYYSTRRESRGGATRGENRGGWMQLKLAGGGKRLRIDSSLKGFGDVVVRAARSARENGIEMAPATEENLRSLGRLAPTGEGGRER